MNREILRIAIPNIISNVTVPLMGIASTFIASRACGGEGTLAISRHIGYNAALNKVVFMCNSWLLYPWMRSVLNDNANLAKFYDDYTIVSSGEYKDYTEIWRLFDCCYNGNPDDLPSDTSLRREYIARIKRQEPVGYGIGVFIMHK